MKDIDDNIQRSLGRIEGKVKEGFEGIHHRLDKMNNSIKDNADKINDLETFRDNVEGGRKEQTRIATLAGALAGGFFSAVVWIASKIFRN